MIVVCPNCQEELADVEALFPFNGAFSCGKCGHTAGQKFEPEPKPAEPAVDPNVPPANPPSAT
jgi:hypothetical protein